METEITLPKEVIRGVLELDDLQRMAGAAHHVNSIPQ
jgi:hypothetical protein